MWNTNGGSLHRALCLAFCRRVNWTIESDLLTFFGIRPLIPNKLLPVLARRLAAQNAYDLLAANNVPLFRSEYW
jgi:hypothetical protein